MVLSLWKRDLHVILMLEKHSIVYIAYILSAGRWFEVVPYSLNLGVSRLICGRE